MSWFKRGKSSDNTAAERTSDHGNDTASNASRSETDPDTCLEVFKNHWTQALSVISRTEEKNGVVSYDDVEAVVQNIQQMVNLLAAEEGLSEDGQGGMPGPILHYLLENNIFEKYYSWCQVQTEYKSKLKLEQLRMFENLIGQTNQILLIHKAVINPLLKLLSSCSEGNIESNLDRSLVLVLHQICACISHQTMILESFFNANANHGPAKFLIFSLLISYIHHEGIVGQQARDALLLIMTLSYKNKHVGEFIAQQSDFCPVLATGLSGLYSSLPRKLPVMTDDWSHISQHDIDQVPGIQMLLNTLEFCNAVVQVAHHSIGEQLIDFIYKGFLVPVMGPALHQDVSGLPLPLLDSPMFANSREEVIAATAYLELFLRKISEPHLTHAFIRFIMTEQNDEIVILDSLVTRINSSSKLLCVTSLSLFRTLIGLNCEDVLFQLVFRHLIPCNHMMISQRGSVKDIDLYGKCAEKFLCLRPRYSTTEKQTNSGSSSIVQPQGSFTGEVLSPSNTTLSNHNNRHNLLTSRKTKRGLGSFLEARRKEQEKQRGRGTPGTDSSKISVQEQLERYESSYIEYLSDARMLLSVTVRSCNGWVYPYNGEYPTPNVFELLDDTPIDEESPSVTPDPKISEPKDKDDNTVSTGKSTTSTDKLHLIIGDKNRPASMRLTPDSPYILPDYKVSFDKVKGNSDFRSFLSVTGDTVRTDALTHQQYEILQILRAFDLEAESWCGGKEGMEEFMKYLSGTTTPPEMEQDDTINESLASLDSILFDMCSSTSSTPLLDVSQQSLLTDFENSGSSSNNHNDDVFRDNSVTNEDGLVSKATCDSHKHVTKDKSEFVEISMSHFVNGENAPELLSKVTRTNTDHADHGSDGKNVPKSVSFDLPVPSKHLPVSSTSSGNVSVPTKPAESKKKPAPDDMTTIGPFLSSLFSKLEGMLQNTLSINLVLTSIIARLAAYPHPLLRSFLLNHNLVFQPSVKSLIQVLTTVKQKLEHFSYTVPNFDDLLLQAHKNLALREENWKLGREHVFYLNPIRETQKPKVLPAVQAKDKKKLSLSDLFKRSPGSNNRRLPTVPKSGGGPQLERIGQGYRYVSRRLPEPKLDNPMDSPKIRNSVYCAIVFEEFLKELAALSQEHSVVVDVT